MLFVETEVRPSTLPGAGLGLFAARDIEVGTIVFRWTRGWDVEWNQYEIVTLSPLSRKTLATFAWVEVIGGTRIWKMSLDNSRFTNHSKVRANIDVRTNTTGGTEMVARRHIFAGEEIFEDYSTYDPDFAEYASTLRDFDEPRPSSGARAEVATK